MAKRRNGGREAQVRQHIAVEAARIMTEEGVRDFAAAKRKAADRLNVGHTRNLPTNMEVEDARLEYQRLFRARSQPARVRELRCAAVQAMKLLDQFGPKLVGPVLAGTADEFSPVSIHVFADTHEEVDLFLTESNIPHEQDERLLRMGPDLSRRFPVYRFQAGDITIDLTVFTRSGGKNPPLSPVDARPMRRVGLSAVERLLDEQDSDAQSFG